VIFVLDTFIFLPDAVAALYVGVVLLSVNFLQWRGVLLVSLGCAALTVLAFLLTFYIGDPFVRLFIGLSAIGITTFLALKNQSVAVELREQARLLDLTHDAILVWEFPGTITYWNRGAEQLYGFSKEEAVGRLSHDLLQTEHPIPAELFEKLIEREGTWAGELTQTTRGGQKLTVDSRHVLVEEDGRRFVLATNHDVTERKEAEKELLRAQAELAHITRVTTLGEFTASIAHEVNQPLAAIVTNGEVSLRWLDRKVPDLAEVREAVDAMISNGRRASDIILRLRALTKKTLPEKVALDMNSIIREVIPLVQGEMLSHRVSLRLELAPTLPIVLGDRVQLQQVIINLVVNAMEAMAAVTKRPRELVIRSQQDDTGQVLVAVKDSGVGIDPENAKQLFNAFFTTKSSGMGMGLSICSSIIENHGGTLWASRNAGPGATFQFTLQPHQEARS
jgi:two-component system, LuxR family, sensor kinase FixL